jgi:cysteine desulfurase / selenocysteine lyase
MLLVAPASGSVSTHRFPFSSPRSPDFPRSIQFPILPEFARIDTLKSGRRRTIRPLIFLLMIYLDNAATSFPKPESVYLALDHFARNSLANPGRAGHKMALAAEHALDDCRHRLNRLFHGAGPDRFAFTLNGTDALNMAMKGVLHPGDHAITTDLEHNSVSRPLRAMEKAGFIELTRIPANAEGTVDPTAFREAIRPNTRLVVVTHASNVIGTVQPVGDIGAICREKKVLFLVDAAQTAGVLPIDIEAMNIDLLALYVAPGVAIRPWREGGTGGDSSTETQPLEFPYYLEGGTPNVLGIAGLAAGIQYVEQHGLAAIHAHEVGLTDRFRAQLDELAGFTVFGHRDSSRRVGTIAFLCDMLPATEIGGILDAEFGIAIRPGLHCAPYVHRAIESYPDGLVRVSPGIFNTASEIDSLVRALRDIAAV